MSSATLDRRRFLALASAGVVFPHSGLGQSQDRAVEGGIGGTGIVGVLTDFGSLVVAGHRILTDDETRFSNPFGRIDRTDVSLGHSLTIEAATRENTLTAQRVQITYPLVGTVEAISKSGRELLVLGTAVFREQAGRNIKIGTRVAISGLWTSAGVAASNVTVLRGGPDLIAGTVDRVSGGVRIGGIRLRGRGLNQLRSGSFATVFGQWQTAETTLLSERAIPGRFTGAAGPLQHLSVEGYLETAARSPGYRIAGLGHSFKPSLKLQPYANSRVLFSGKYDGLFDADTARILPVSPQERRKLLRAASRNQ